MTLKGKLNPGDILISPYGKKIEIVKKEGGEYVAKVLCIGDDVGYRFPEDYIVEKCTLIGETQNLDVCLDESNVPCACTECDDTCCEDLSCQENCKEDVEEEQDVEEDVVKKEEVNTVELKEKKTIKSVILSQLAEGPKTNEELAKAIIDAGISQQTDLKKIKTYVSINLSNLKKEGMKIENVGRGKHQLVVEGV